MQVRRIVISGGDSRVPPRNILSTGASGVQDLINGVCPHCNNLDLDELFARCDLTDLGIGTPLVNLRNFSREHRKSSCRTCQFLAKSSGWLLAYDRPFTWHVRAFDYDRLRLRHEYDEVMSIVDYSRLLSRRTTHHDRIRPENLVLALTPDSVHDHCSQDPQQSPSYCFLPTKRLLTTKDSSGYEGRPIEEKVCYHIFSTALHNCQRNHEQCQTLPPSIRGLRVIDCTFYSVIDFPGGSYAALSYCIGDRTKQPQCSWDSDSSDPDGSLGWPRVVMDAVKCCRKLQIRYLWVDQLCLDQNDPVNLAAAISQMHEIYSSATVTIVSLGAQQSRGLPGVRGTPRYPTPRLKTQKNTYVMTPSHLIDELHASKWMTRGWCYQEAVLSRRLLIIASEQVFFVCNHSMVFESIAGELLHSATPNRSQARASPYMLALSKGPTLHGPWAFGEWIAAYTARDLSYQSDILNAFRGILNVSAHQTYWGIPFVRKSDSNPYNHAEAFAIGLSWATSYNTDCFDASWKGLETPLGAGHYQRTDFPTWSWAGCRVFKNPILYTGCDGRALEEGADLSRIIDFSEIEIAFEDNAGKEIPAAEFIHQHRVSPPVLPEMSRFIHIQAETIQVGLYQLKSDGYNDDIQNDDQNEYGDSINRSLGPYHDEEEIDWSNIARFCVNMEDDPDFAPQLSYYALDPESDQYMVDLDWPPTTKDNRNKELHGKQYLGLILFFCPWKPRPGDDDPHVRSITGRGAYSVLLCERHHSGQFYMRVGRAWVPERHLQFFQTVRQKIRLG